jgi:heat shock protein HslJ
MPASPYRLPALTLALAAFLAAPAFADGAEAADDIIGTSWQLTELNGAPTSTEITSTANFSADGVGGNGGCNTYGGTLAVTSGGIDITEIISTMMACDGLAQEQAFFAALEATTGYRIENRTLHLTGPDDAVLAELAPAE